MQFKCLSISLINYGTPESWKDIQLLKRMTKIYIVLMWTDQQNAVLSGGGKSYRKNNKMWSHLLKIINHKVKLHSVFCTHLQTCIHAKNIWKTNTHTHLISINRTMHRLKGGCKRNVPLLFIMGILLKKKKCVPLYLHSNKMTNSKHIGKSPKAPMNPEPHETRPLPNSKFLFMRRVSNTTDKQLLFRKLSNLFFKFRSSAKTTHFDQLLTQFLFGSEKVMTTLIPCFT